MIKTKDEDEQCKLVARSRTQCTPCDMSVIGQSVPLFQRKTLIIITKMPNKFRRSITNKRKKKQNKLKISHKKCFAQKDFLLKKIERTSISEQKCISKNKCSVSLLHYHKQNESIIKMWHRNHSQKNFRNEKKNNVQSMQIFKRDRDGEKKALTWSYVVVHCLNDA